jgi:Dolichyl-phosphate-mannose-protein mannosyltransferase
VAPADRDQAPTRVPETERPRRRSFRRLAAVLAVVGALHGLLYSPFAETHVATDSGTYLATASALRDGGYSTPLRAGFYYTFPTGFFEITGLRIPRAAWSALERQAFRPPGYPVFLAALGGGDQGASQVAVLLAQGVLFGLGVWVLALLARELWGPGIALVAAGVYAVDPWSKHYVKLLLSETLAGLLALATAYAFARAWSARSLRWWAAVGVLAASITLVRAVFVFAVPLLAAAAVLQSGSPGERLRRLAATALAAFCLLAPWLVWTSGVSGKPVLANWGEGYNLLVAAYGEGLGRTQTDVAEDPAFERELDAAHRSAPSLARLLDDPEAHPRYLARADAELRDRAWSRYGRRLRDEPIEVASEWLYRAYFLWMAHEDWYQPSGLLFHLLRTIDWATLLLAALGAAIGLRLGGVARALAIALLVYTAILATHHVEARFAMPLRGIYLAFAVLGAAALAERLAPARTASV